MQAFPAYFVSPSSAAGIQRDVSFSDATTFSFQVTRSPFSIIRTIELAIPTFRDRLTHGLQAAGKQVTDDDVVYAWTDYSGGLCANWLGLPDDDAILLTTLPKHLPSSPSISPTTIRDACDGSGDQKLAIPTELFDQMGWKESDRLAITKSGTEELIPRRVD
ncbi:hypothetical protein [Herbaspirillum sp. ST 5-3]|uniref:hypothetical protein n=1 Tax=Oxalobacteraceae TaxID=75682 RepID=UPI0010A3AB11|nr:hypothetical protein [Herbaspirillum sp. ST 5-3]